MSSPSEAPFSRFRLTEETAQLVEASLKFQRRLALRERRSAIIAKNDDRLTEANRILKLIDWVLAEIEDVQVSNRWHDASGRLVTD